MFVLIVPDPIYFYFSLEFVADPMGALVTVRPLGSASKNCCIFINIVDLP